MREVALVEREHCVGTELVSENDTDRIGQIQSERLIFGTDRLRGGQVNELLTTQPGVDSESRTPRREQSPVNESAWIQSPIWPDEGREGTITDMAGRKRYSAEEIVRKLRLADDLTAARKTGEEIAAEIGISPATLYNWRRQYGGVDTDAAKELKQLREQNARLKRLLADAELEKDALREIAKGKW